jgi:hypothetical protein
MARKHEAVTLLKNGLSPTRIAAQMAVSTETIMGYLCNQVGEGAILLSDILFAIDGETRAAVKEIQSSGARWSEYHFRQLVHRKYPSISQSDAWVYYHLSSPTVYLGDMYTWLYVWEQLLHGYIRGRLTQAFGPDWWRKGIPENIRSECAAALERDPEPAAEPYCYTTIIHLKDIFERSWRELSKGLPPAAAADRKRFLSGLTRLNQIRNRVMHAAKGIVPSEDDFRFLREYLNFACPIRLPNVGEGEVVASPNGAVRS